MVVYMCWLGADYLSPKSNWNMDGGMEYSLSSIYTQESKMYKFDFKLNIIYHIIIMCYQISVKCLFFLLMFTKAGILISTAKKIHTEQMA